MKEPSTLKPEQASRIPPEVFSQLIMKIAEFTSALLAKDPDMPRHLQESHRLLISYPETAHLLDDEEIAELIKGQEALMHTQIVSDAAKKKSSSGATKRLSSSDL